MRIRKSPHFEMLRRWWCDELSSTGFPHACVVDSTFQNDVYIDVCGISLMVKQ